MSDVLGPGPHTRVRRLPEKARYDESSVSAVLDAALYGHLCAEVDGLAMALATLHLRRDRTLYFHASRSNALLRSALARGEAAYSVTLFDGVRLARSGFESSIAYRSALVVGPVREIEDGDEKTALLEAFIDAVAPGRAAEVRPMSDREARLTLVVALDIAEASVKVSAGPTDDPEEDLDLPIWSGTVPARLVYGEPVSDERGAMATGAIEVPASVRRLRSEG